MSYTSEIIYIPASNEIKFICIYISLVYTMTQNIYEIFKKLADEKKFSEVKALIDKNPETFNNYEIRRKAKRYLQNRATCYEIDKLLPSRLNTRGNKTIEAVERIMKGSDVDNELGYIQSISKTNNAANVAVSAIKKELKRRGFTSGVNDISTSPVKDNIVIDTIEEREEAIAQNGEKVFIINPYFNYENVYNRLMSYIKNIDTLDITDEVIADMMINFAARPSELYNLVLSNGMISGQSKTRGAEIFTKFIGILPFAESKLLLDKIKQYPKMSPVGIRRTGQFGRFMKKYGMIPRQLRALGAEFASMSETNKIKRLRKRQSALRHKDLSSSLLHYDISDRIKYNT